MFSKSRSSVMCGTPFHEELWESPVISRQGQYHEYNIIMLVLFMESHGTSESYARLQCIFASQASAHSDSGFTRRPISDPAAGISKFGGSGSGSG